MFRRRIAFLAERRCVSTAQTKRLIPRPASLLPVMIFFVEHGRWGSPGLPQRIFEQGEIRMTMSQSSKVRIVHYLNQFFSGLGGEEQAGYPITVQPGAMGPGTALQNLLQNAEIVATIICGDKWYHEHEPKFEAAV